MTSRLVAACIAVTSALAIAYHQVIPKLVRDWRDNDDYSHGFLIVPLIGYLVWQRRQALRTAVARPVAGGLLVVLLGVVMLAAGLLGAELFISRVSIPVTLAGIALFLGGWAHLRLLAFPLALMLLTIPIPAIIFNQVAFPLQLLASRFGAAALWTVGIPVLREGNIITLASTTLEVAEACSGIRSLVALFTLSLVYGYFNERATWKRAVLVVSIVPIAIVANAMRVTAIGVAAHLYGPTVVDGPFHSISGWLVFIVAFAVLLGVHRLMRLGRRTTPVAPQREMTAAV